GTGASAAAELARRAGAGAQSAEAEAPPLAAAGLQAYRDGGTDSALTVWFHGGPIDSPESRATMRQAFQTMQRRAGAMTGYDFVKTFALGSHVRRVFVVLHYEIRPGFLVLDLYRSPGGWTLQNISFNDAAEKVFPASLLQP